MPTANEIKECQAGRTTARTECDLNGRYGCGHAVKGINWLRSQPQKSVFLLINYNSFFKRFRFVVSQSLRLAAVYSLRTQCLCVHAILEIIKSCPRVAARKMRKVILFFCGPQCVLCFFGSRNKGGAWTSHNIECGVPTMMHQLVAVPNLPYIEGDAYGCEFHSFAFVR